MSETQIEGLIAVVTGAGSGVGKYVALKLASKGAKVALAGRRVSRLNEVKEIILQSKGTTEVFPCDISDIAQVDQMQKEIIRCLGIPQILFNGAGIHCQLLPTRKSDPHDWVKSFQVNTIGPYLICRAFMNEMISKGWGRIINVSSAASLNTIRHIGTSYQLSKVALNHFTRQIAIELDGTGVTASVIHPGDVQTEMWAAIKADATLRGDDAKEMKEWADGVGKSGGDPPEKAAELVLDLISAKEETINGKFLWIKDGVQKPVPSW